MLIIMDTARWIVVALDAASHVAGPFPDQDIAEHHASHADGASLVVHVARAYSPERGSDEFAIRSR